MTKRVLGIESIITPVFISYIRFFMIIWQDISCKFWVGIGQFPTWVYVAKQGICNGSATFLTFCALASLSSALGFC